MDAPSANEEREEVWSATKAAVRRYSRNPSEANAEGVKSACRRLRDLPSREAPAANEPPNRGVSAARPH